MLKGIGLLAIVTIGVFFGMLSYEKYITYKAQIAIDEELANQQFSAMMRKKTLEFYRNKRNADELYRNTACAINVDARTCKCIHEKTGLRISLDDAECKTRAIQKTP